MYLWVILETRIQKIILIYVGLSMPRWQYIDNNIFMTLETPLRI